MMKTTIQILLVALVFGGASAGGSYYWLKLNKKPDPQEPVAKTEKTEDQDTKIPDAQSLEISETQAEETPTEAPAEVKSIKSTPKTEPVSYGPPVAARPPFNPNADEAGELIYKLRVRLASSTRQERRVAEREDAMKLIVEDLRSEQSKTAKMKKQLFEEQTQSMKSIDEARKAIDTERTMLYGDIAETKRQTEEKLEIALREKEDAIRAVDDQMKSARDQIEDLRKQLDEARKPANANDRSGSPELSANLKKTASTLDSMPPEATAKILKETVKEGRTEAVVALLNAMKPRVCAKVITEISETDSELAADLVERLKRLKKEAEAAKTPATATAPAK